VRVIPYFMVTRYGSEIHWDRVVILIVITFALGVILWRFR